MKTINIILAVIFISTLNVQSQVYDDDIYYSPGDEENTYSNSDNPGDDGQAYYVEDYSEPTATDTIISEDGNTYIDNYYVEGDYYDDTYDYYDYEYSSRIRRFHHGTTAYGYYHDYYTNCYWYDYDPIYWGVSIYLGYRWWYPRYVSYRPSLYVGYGGYYGWGGYYGVSYYNSYCGYGYPYYGYSSYWNGYNNGYYDGYWGGSYDNYYYNSYDSNSPRSTYYGHRNSFASNSGLKAPETLGDKYSKYNKASLNKSLAKDNVIAKKVKYTGPDKVKTANEKGKTDKVIANSPKSGERVKNNSKEKVSTKYEPVRKETKNVNKEVSRPSKTSNVYKESREKNYSSGVKKEKVRTNESKEKSSVKYKSYSKPKAQYKTTYSKPKQRESKSSYSPTKQSSYEPKNKVNNYSSPKPKVSKSYSKPRQNNSTPKSRSGGSSYKSAPKSSGYSSKSHSGRSSNYNSGSRGSSSGRSGSYSSPSRSSSSGRSGSYSSPSKSHSGGGSSKSSGSRRR